MKFALLLLLLSSQDDAAWKLLGDVAARHRDAKTISCAYTQERRSALLKDPLVSKGTLYYRRDPARLVFVVSEPRKAFIHLSATSYEVYRPQENQLEKFEFETNELATALLQSISPDVETWKKDFEVKSLAEKEGVSTIEFAPRRAKIKEFLGRLKISIRPASAKATSGERDGALLSEIAYTDSEGDEIRIVLSDLKLNPDLPAATFALDVPKDARVLVHRVRR